MKIKSSVLSKIVPGFLVCVVLAACNNKQQTVNKAAVVPDQPTKETIVYINQDTLLAKYQYAVDATKALQDKGKAAQAEVTSKGQAIQHEIEEYQKNANTMPADQRQTTEQHLQREQEDFSNYRQNATAGLQNETITTQNNVYNKIADFAKKYAKEKGYKLVLMYSKSNSSVLYGDSTLDITAEVVKGLNDANAKEKK